jgi:hypothetical protein
VQVWGQSFDDVRCREQECSDDHHEAFNPDSPDYYYSASFLSFPMFVPSLSW